MSRVHDILLKDLYTTVEKAQLGNIIKYPQAGTGIPQYLKITYDNPDNLVNPKGFKECTQDEFVALKNKSNKPGSTQPEEGGRRRTRHKNRRTKRRHHKKRQTKRRH